MPVWIQALLSLAGIMIAAIPGVWAAYNVKTNQRKQAEADAATDRRTNDIERRKVDAEAFDRAAKFWEASLNAAEDRIKELESVKATLEHKNERLSAELQAVRDIVMQMRGALIAAGLSVPEIQNGHSS